MPVYTNHFSNVKYEQLLLYDLYGKLSTVVMVEIIKNYSQ